MFSFKKKYFLIIESIKDIDLSNIKIANKFNIIYRNRNKIVNFHKLLKFRLLCKSKRIGFYAANDIKLALDLKTDGFYISAHNKSLRHSQLKKLNYEIIGSAHNLKELNIKILQGCSNIILSRLFKTSYPLKQSFMGVIKYNLLNVSIDRNLIPLGGIRMKNLNKLKMVECNSIALMSEVKKKPAIIFSRLF